MRFRWGCSIVSRVARLTKHIQAATIGLELLYAVDMTMTPATKSWWCAS